MSRKRSAQDNTDAPAEKSSHWALGLLSAMKDPTLVIEEDSSVVVIKDKYPKAEHHFLVLPKADVSLLRKLNKEHIPLLEHMQDIGYKVSKRYPNRKFRLGYHAVASMIRLHLHVVSDDFVSPYLKTKKHWNSFTTSFFIPPEKIIADIKQLGHVSEMSQSEATQLMKSPLICHKCNFEAPNIPKLKLHLLKHVTDEVH